MTRALTPRNRSGQTTMSFGMIFSIILIIIFLAFGFYAIKKFVDMQGDVQINIFLEDFQDDVNDSWKNPQGGTPIEVSYNLPVKITSICFKDDEFENLQFTSKNIIRGKNIENIDIKNTLNGENSLCIQNVKGKVSFKLAKEYGDTLVTIKE